LGMMLSEYILQMHTTPVACNSVSGALGFGELHAAGLSWARRTRTATRHVRQWVMSVAIQRIQLCACYDALFVPFSTKLADAMHMCCRLRR
jgi:hypothetical protein